MESIKNIFFIIGVVVASGSIYGVITYSVSDWLNGDPTDDADTFLGSWIIGGTLFIAMTLLWICALGII